jgi:hypothetical protein
MGLEAGFQPAGTALTRPLSVVMQLPVGVSPSPPMAFVERCPEWEGGPERRPPAVLEQGRVPHEES